MARKCWPPAGSAVEKVDQGCPGVLEAVGGARLWTGSLCPLLSELLAPRQLSQCLGGCQVVHTEWPRGPPLQLSAPLAET